MNTILNEEKLYLKISIFNRSIFIENLSEKLIKISLNFLYIMKLSP